MARVAAQEGRIDEAVGYYHHAIDGAWSANAAERRVQARIELIQALGKAGRRQQAQAELLSMPTVMPGDFSVKRQAAPLSQDAKAWAGLGDAE
jgi:hypothetical protein